MKKNKKGFTLVELVIVVAVMAVLVAVAIPTVTSITKSAQRAVADTNAHTIESTLKLMEAELSNNNETFTELSKANIEKALNDAKLGVTGTFAYDPSSGIVTPIYPANYQEAGDLTAVPEDQVSIVITDGTAVATLPEADAGNAGGENAGGENAGEDNGTP